MNPRASGLISPFPKRKGERRRQVDPPHEEKLKFEEKDENLPDTIQGKPVRSKEEARVGVSLGIVGFNFKYQVWIFGGNIFPGGQIIDYLVYTVPLPTPLYLQSAYWHGPEMVKRQDDLMKQAKVRQRMSRTWADPKELWDHELQSIAQTVSAIRREFGRP